MLASNFFRPVRPPCQWSNKKKTAAFALCKNIQMAFWNSLYNLLSVFYEHPSHHCESRLGFSYLWRYIWEDAFWICCGSSWKMKKVCVRISWVTQAASDSFGFTCLHTITSSSQMPPLSSSRSLKWPVDPPERLSPPLIKENDFVWLPFPSYLDCKVFSSCLCSLASPESEEIHSLSCVVFCVTPRGLQFTRCNSKPFFSLHPQSGYPFF